MGAAKDMQIEELNRWASEPWVIGEWVTWLHAPRGGYGYTFPVEGIVRAVGPKRVCILVNLKSGDSVERWVKPVQLRPLMGMQDE